MKTLRKTLALVLVLALSVSFFAFSASATSTSYNSYSDKDTINYKDAVSILSGLGVINGFEDGSFQPKGNVTRAQMAKLIAYALLGADDADDLSASADVFTDVPANHWAAGYIQFCVNMGIIDGYGDGTFGPNDNVTGYQIAKMLLCAIGYGQNDEYTGTNWSANVSKKALALDLFDGYVAGLTNKAATREEACLYLWNALNIQMVTYDSDDGYTGLTYKNDDNDSVDQTLGHKNYSIAKITGLVIANGDTDSDFAPDTDDSTPGKTEIQYKDGDSTETATYSVDTDLSLIGHTVTIYYDEDDSDTAYAAVDKTDVSKAVNISKSSDYDNETCTALRSAGFTIKSSATDDDISVYVSTNYGDFSATATKLSALDDKHTYLFMSDDSDNNKPLYAIEINEAVYKVYKLNATTKTVTLKTYNNGTKTFDYDDVVSDISAIAVDDYVVGTIINSDYVSLTTCKTVTGTIKAANSAKDTITIDGTKYTGFAGNLATTDLNDSVKTLDEVIGGDYIDDGDTFTVYLDSNGYFVMVTSDESSSASNLVLVYDCVNKLASDGDYYTTNSYVKALTLDGTQVTYETASDESDNFSNYTGSVIASSADAATHDAQPKTFMYVSVDSDGIATLTPVAAAGTSINGTKYYLDTIAKSYDFDSTDTSATVTNGTAVHSKDYINSSTNYIFVNWDDDDDTWNVSVKTGGVNYTTGSASAAISTKSGSNYIAKAVAFGAEYASTSTAADSVIYFDNAGQSDYTGYYNFKGYDCATGTKNVYVVKSAKDSSGNLVTLSTGKLNGFYKFTVDSDGYYTLTQKAADNKVYYADQGYVGYYGDLINTTNLSDGDFTDAVIVDARTTAELNADDAWDETITSVGDIDDATDSGYTVTMQVLGSYDDGDVTVLTIIVTSVVPTV